MMAYVGKEPSGKYEPFVFRQALREGELEVAEDVFLITKDAAEAYLAGREPSQEPAPAPGTATPGPTSGRWPRRRHDNPHATTCDAYDP